VRRARRGHLHIVYHPYEQRSIVVRRVCVCVCVCDCLSAYLWIYDQRQVLAVCLLEKKGKEEYLYSAFYILCISQSAQA